MKIDPSKLKQLRKSDVLIVSFPRSGNTWTRVLIADVLLQLRGHDTSKRAPVLPIHPDIVIPDLHVHDVSDAGMEATGLHYRLFKSHNPAQLRSFKCIYLFRKPLDTLVSFYHFHLRFEHLHDRATAGSEAFCTEHRVEYLDHLRAGMAAKKKNRDRVLFTAYESLHAQPLPTLRMMCDFLGIEAPDDVLHRSIENHVFEKHHKAAVVGPNNERFFRYGKPGGWAQDLSQEFYDKLSPQLTPVYEKALALMDAYDAFRS